MLDFSVTFFITIINVAVLYLVMRKLLWNRVTKFMAERTRRVEESIERSEKDKAQAKVLLSQYEDQLKTAEAEAGNIIRDARVQAQLEADRIMAESRAAAEQTLANTRKHLELERKAALAAFRNEAASIVIMAAGGLIGRELKSEDSELYANKLLEEAALPEEAALLKEAAEN